MMNHLELLKKYMIAVSSIEGHDFTHLIYEGECQLTTEDVEELDRLSKELEND